MSQPNSEEELSQTPSEQKSEQESEQKEFDIISFNEEDGSKTVFSLFGFEFIAPKGMKNPLLIYGLFIVVNISLFMGLRSLLN